MNSSLPPECPAAAPDAIASLRERMHRGCAATGRTHRQFLVAELEQAQRLQATHSAPIITAGQATEAAALFLLRELPVQL